LRAAPQAQAVCSFVGANVMVNDFADRPARVLADDEVLAIGRHRLRFLSTPHVPHCWDAGLFFETVDRTLLWPLHPPRDVVRRENGTRDARASPARLTRSPHGGREPMMLAAVRHTCA
jgi:hypothetical protein